MIGQYERRFWVHEKYTARANLCDCMAGQELSFLDFVPISQVSRTW